MYSTQKLRPSSVEEVSQASLRTHYPNFDLMRLLLASEVAFVHAWFLTDATFDWNGYIMAVPAFLAISGFLVLKSYEDSPYWRVFIQKRALRILPALLFSMLVCWILFDLDAVFNSFLNWATGGLYTLPGVANGPLWSLAWEELAYLSLAVLWALGAYRRPIVIWILLALSFVVVYLGRSLDSHTQMLLFLLPSFFIGNLAYLHRSILLKVHPLVPWIFLLVVINGSAIPYFNQIHQLSPVAFQAFSVVWVCIAGLKIVPFRFPDISYGIYILHMPIIFYLVDEKIATTTREMAIWLPVPLLLTCLFSWYLVEKPALKRKTRLRGKAAQLSQSTNG